jgi:hypothetical protein
MTLRGLGRFQDGGLCANCPVRPAMRESARIWPSVRRPDLIVSIGTGFTPEQQGQKKETIGFFQTLFIWRLVEAFLCSPACDGAKGWKDAFNSMSDELKEDAIRLDYPLPEPLPELDDVDQMEWISNLQYDIPAELQRKLDAKSFFFELDEDPTVSENGYCCRGSILCGKRDTTALLTLVQRDLPNADFMTGQGSNLGRVHDHDGCTHCGYYRKRVTLLISRLQDDIEIGMVSESQLVKIGGFPTSIEAIITNQQANAVFGRADHQTDRWPPARDCYCITGRKRNREESTQHITARFSKKVCRSLAQSGRPSSMVTV